MKTIPILMMILLSTTIISCKQQPKQSVDAKEQEIPSKIDFNMDATPVCFSAKTIDGKVFNSEEHKDEYWIVFIYDKHHFAKNEEFAFDILSDFNTVFETFKDKFRFVGIIEGFVETDNELDSLINSRELLPFPQIDNTKSYDKQEKINHNVFCTPAKIVIAPNGKVIYNGCGGTSTSDITDILENIEN